jgi:phosphatidate cytidylyltransferase
MAMNWPTFFKRAGSAVVFCIVMVAGLFSTDFAFLTLMLVVQALCLHEYFKLMTKIYPGKPFPLELQAMVQFLGFALVFLAFPAGVVSPQRPPFVLWPVLLCVPVLLLLLQALSPKGSVDAAFKAFGALLYITLPLALLTQLRETNWLIPVSLIFMIWINDTMAYIVGSFIGKTPFSKISPKKTWEGTAGGALLSVGAAVLWGVLWAPYYCVQDWIALSLCASVAGTAGDLLESKLKRMADVKDSGAIMPGHGGALDRFDSLLVAAPFAFAYAYIFMPHIR